MFRVPRFDTATPKLDLATMRETVSYMHDDVRQMPGLDRLSSAFGVVLQEIEAAEKRADTPRTLPLRRIRFLTRRK